MKIVWSTTALRRVANITAEIERDDPDRAHDIVTRIFDKVERLAEFPEMVRVVP